MATPYRNIARADSGWIAHRIVTYALQPPADNPLSSARAYVDRTLWTEVCSLMPRHDCPHGYH